ncbi:MAG: hypothetical protein P8Y80_03525, partial [Acidobacteriota bacterium]
PLQALALADSGQRLEELKGFPPLEVLGVDPEVALLVAFLERFAYYFHTLVLGGFCLICLRIGMKCSVSEQICMKTGA